MVFVCVCVHVCVHVCQEITSSINSSHMQLARTSELICTFIDIITLAIDGCGVGIVNAQIPLAGGFYIDFFFFFLFLFVMPLAFYIYFYN